MKEEQVDYYFEKYAYDYEYGDTLPDLDIWWANPFYDTEPSFPGFDFVRMFWFTPKLKYEYALWYTINFYITVVGFTFEFLLLLAIFRDILKKKSELRNFYYLLTFVTIIVDMLRFFMPADYSFSPSYFFSTGVSRVIRNIYIVYGVFMSIFVPTCQLALTINRMTAVVFPLRHKKIWSKRISAVIMIFVIAFPVVTTIPYAIFQNIGLYKYMFLKISVGGYTKVIVLIGITFASIATLIGLTILIKVFLVSKNSSGSALELRLLVVVMTSNIGCICYNIFQLLLYRAYLNKNTQMKWLETDFHLLDKVRFYDELSKSILIAHNYTSVFLLIRMSTPIRQEVMRFYFLDKVLSSRYFRKLQTVLKEAPVVDISGVSKPY